MCPPLSWWVRMPSTMARKASPRTSKLGYWSNDAQAGESSTTGSLSPEPSASRADTSTDPEVRKEFYKKALTKISGRLYWLPMFTYAKYYAFSEDLDFQPTSDEIPRFYTAKWK